jgi:nitrogen fixation NifU-like protein
MDFDDLYQEIILDHYRHPRHAAKVSDEELVIEEENPTCGDQIRLTATLKDGIVQDIRHECHGCAISTASASMMADELVGKPIGQVRRRIHDFVALMRSEKSALDDDPGDLIALEGVRNYPLRIKCATMCWHAAEQAIDKLAGKA